MKINNNQFLDLQYAVLVQDTLFNNRMFVHTHYKGIHVFSIFNLN